MKKCTYCGYGNLTTLRTINGYELLTCSSCGLTITNLVSRLNQSEINLKVYSNEYLKLYEERQSLLINRFASKVKLIDKYSRGGNILDVGCSTGLFLKSVDKYSFNKWSKYGIDINKKSINLARKKNIGKFYCDNLYRINFPENYFDVITCFDVLEHDRDLKGNLRDIRRILKPKGALVIQVPNRDSCMAKLCGDNWDWWSVPDHIYHFTPSILKKIIYENGFNLNYIKTWEDKVDFIRNIQGSIRKKFTRIFYINKIAYKSSYPFLYLMYLNIKVIENVFNVGGLITIVSTNNKYK